MATQSVRNIINNTISRALPELKKRAKEEGEKKLMELKDQLLSPETIINALQATIDSDTCSLKGKEQYEKKVKSLNDTLTTIEEQTIKGIEAIQSVEEKIAIISAKGDPPEGVTKPIDTINEITTSASFLIESLNIIIQAAPAILGAQVSVPGAGGPVSGTVITNTNNGVNFAKAKIKEFQGMFQALPRQLDQYQRMADKIYDDVNKIKNQIQPIIDEIGRLKMFIVYLEMDFLNKCNDYFASPKPPVETPPPYPPSITLDDIINQAESLYGDLLNSLIASGNTRAIERIHALNEDFIRIKTLRARWLSADVLETHSYQAALADYENLYSNENEEANEVSRPRGFTNNLY